MKRIGLLSDTHSYLNPKIYKYFEECDEIWHAGDIGDIAVTDELAKFKPLKAVYGNIDNNVIRVTHPLNQRFECEGVDVWMTHIGGRPGKYTRDLIPEMMKNPPKLFICGHSHICRVEFDKRFGCLYMNPGACGISGFHQVCTIIRFTIDAGNIKDLEVIELGPRSSRV
jgi:putative phosphoesterase